MTCVSMSNAIAVLRRGLQYGIRLGRAVNLVCVPWLLLAIRIWLSQIVFAHRIMMMMMVVAGSGHVAPFTLDAAVQGVGPLLLASGLLTCPVALALLVETDWSLPGLNAGSTLPEAALLAWLLVSGPGAAVWVCNVSCHSCHGQHGSVDRPRDVDGRSAFGFAAAPVVRRVRRRPAVV